MADCWTCGAERGRAAFCGTCGKIQPVVRGTSFFDVLGLPAKMGISRSALEKGYRELSRQVHPDRFGRESPLERKLALEQTTVVNDAYRTLRQPRTRAEYLMRLAGKVVGKETDRVDDPEFLMQMMELREQLSDVESAEQAEPLRDDVQVEYDAALEKLSAYFDEGRGTEAEAMKQLEALRFFERFLEEVDARFDI